MRPFELARAMPAARRPLTALRTQAAALVAGFRGRRQARRTYRALAALSDRDLADIGLNRTMLLNADELTDDGSR